jgi:hypothetical protein
MRRVHRLIAASVLIAFTGVLGGCSSGFGSNFDPTDLLDWLDTKKKLPGERKPVFPEGVPGLEQGVPKDLYKGAQQQPDVPPNPQYANAPPPPSQQPLEPPPGSKAALKKLKSQQPAPAANAAAAPAQPGAEPDGETAAASQQDGTQTGQPAPKPKKIVRKRTTAPPPDATDAQPTQQGAPAAQQQPAAQSAQQAPAPFPAPLPGSFSRQ